MSDEKHDPLVFFKEFFMCFTKDTDLETAKKKFKDKYKADPEISEIDGQILWVGPIYNFRR